jgi:hypothetical protein
MRFFRVLGNLLRFDRANWKAVVLCILAASIFWLFNAFNKNHVATIKFPIRFEYDQAKYIPIEALPTQIGINVSGNGWDLIRNQLGLKLPLLVIPLDRPTDAKKIVAASLSPLLQPQLEKLLINFLISDTLRLRLDEKDFHKFKVKPDFTDFSFRKGFGKISPVVILPDSVTLEGPKSVLHQMPDYVFVKVEGDAVDKNHSAQLEIFVATENVTLNPTRVKVLFEVGQVVDVERKLKLVSKIKTTPSDSVMARFRIPVKREEEFKNQLTEMTAIVAPQPPDPFGIVSATIRNTPSYAEVISIDTVRVEPFLK